MEDPIEKIVEAILAEAAIRYQMEKADCGCMGSIASKIHGVVADVMLELGQRGCGKHATIE